MDISQEEEMLAVAPSGATEVSLIEESVWGAVRGLREQGVSKREIGRRLDLDIKTVRKWLLAALQEAVLKELISLGLLGGARTLAEKPGQASSTQNRQVSFLKGITSGEHDWLKP